MSQKKLGFTGVNYYVCGYCAHLVRDSRNEGWTDGCRLRKNNEGKYARTSGGDEELRKKRY